MHLDTERVIEKQNDRRMINDLGFATIIDLLPCYLSIQDPSLNILFANQNFIKDFGEGIGRPCHTVYKKSSEICVSCPVQKSFKDKEVHISEESVQLSNGEMAQLLVYSKPILDPLGNVMAVIEMSTNITKIKKMQEELTILGQSIATLSHDFKNILEGLQGGAYVVDEGIKDGDMGLTGKGWKIVKKNIDEILRIAQNILYSSKKRGVKYQRVSPTKIVEDVVELFQEKARAMDVQLECQANPSLPLTNLDPSGIRSMLSNLIWNALQACDRDKEKALHTLIVKTDFYDKFHIMFQVEDNGIGMDENTRKDIFKGFYSTKEWDGTGLGLLVVDRIVKAHGGRIEVLTAPGKGSTFRIIIRTK